MSDNAISVRIWALNEHKTALFEIIRLYFCFRVLYIRSTCFRIIYLHAFDWLWLDYPRTNCLHDDLFLGSENNNAVTCWWTETCAWPLRNKLVHLPISAKFQPTLFLNITQVICPAQQRKWYLPSIRINSCLNLLTCSSVSMAREFSFKGPAEIWRARDVFEC